MNTKTLNGKRGIDVLRDPELNKLTAFTDAEKQALGIVGLVLDVTETENLQLSRVQMQLGHKTTDLDRYIYLVSLLDHNEALFYGAAAAVERELYLDAYSWAMSDDCSWPFSFLNVCRLLNHEPIRLRDKLLGDPSLGIIALWARRGSRALRRLSDSLKRRSAIDHKSTAATSENILQASY